jgi:hypothetical protein
MNQIVDLCFVVACWIWTAPYALKSGNICHFLIGLELSTQGCSRISVSEESMVQRGGQTYFALWKIVGNYLLGRKIWNHFASSRFLLLYLHKISQKKYIHFSYANLLILSVYGTSTLVGPANSSRKMVFIQTIDVPLLFRQKEDGFYTNYWCTSFMAYGESIHTLIPLGMDEGM